MRFVDPRRLAKFVADRAPWLGGFEDHGEFPVAGGFGSLDLSLPRTRRIEYPRRSSRKVPFG